MSWLLNPDGRTSLAKYLRRRRAELMAQAGENPVASIVGIVDRILELELRLEGLNRDMVTSAEEEGEVAVWKQQQADVWRKNLLSYVQEFHLFGHSPPFLSLPSQRAGKVEGLLAGIRDKADAHITVYMPDNSRGDGRRMMQVDADLALFIGHLAQLAETPLNLPDGVQADEIRTVAQLVRQLGLHREGARVIEDGAVEHPAALPRPEVDRLSARLEAVTKRLYGQSAEYMERCGAVDEADRPAVLELIAELRATREGA